MNGLAPEGIAGLVYFDTGANLVCLAYFFIQSLRRDKPKETRSVLFKANKQFDWYVFCLLLGTGAMQILCIMSIIFTFDLAKKANLNIGIVSALWSLCPFGTALLDWIIYRVLPLKSHLVGMLSLMCCAVLVSLSGLLTTPTIETEATVDVYVPVLCSLTLVPIVAFYILFSKEVTDKQGVNPNDWTCAYSLVVFMPLQVLGLCWWVQDPESFRVDYFCWGLLSAFEVLGCIVFNNLFKINNAPIGPMLALMNIGTIEMLVFGMIATNSWPHWMQLLGFLFGFIGALILSAPDLMYHWWMRATCRG